VSYVISKEQSFSIVPLLVLFWPSF